MSMNKVAGTQTQVTASCNTGESASNDNATPSKAAGAI